MKRIILLLSLLFVIVGSVMGQEPGEGPGLGPREPERQRYTVKGEEFSVILPLSPMMRTSRGTRRSDGKVRVEKYLKLTFDSVYYTIDAFENPEPKQSLAQFIDERGGLTGLFDPATRRDLTVDGFNGIEYSSKTFPATVQFLATENHLYRFYVSGQVANRRGMMEFFSSIKLGQEPGGVEVTDYTGEWIYTGKEVDVKARILNLPEPSYTQDARKNRIEGTVVLKVVFTKDGQVTNIRTITGLPDGLTEQAIKAARKIKFTPAMKEGKPVSMWMQLEYNFTL